MSKKLKPWDLRYTIRNVKKGTLDRIDKEVKTQDSRGNDIWNRWKDKYSQKQPNCPFEDLLVGEDK